MAQSTLSAVRDLAPLSAKYADEAERERRLARPVVDALVDAGVFRLLVPPALGGAGASPMEFCEIVEAVSTVDGSTPLSNNYWQRPPGLDHSDGPSEKVVGSTGAHRQPELLARAVIEVAA